MMPALDRQLQANEYENAIILPSKSDTRLGGVVDNRGCFVDNSAYSNNGLCLWGGQYDIAPEEIEESEEIVVFIGHLQRHWGNFLFDNLGRLWYALEHPGCKYVYCGFDVHDEDIKSNKNNYLDVFQAIGVESEQLLEITKPTRFCRVVVPELGLFPGTYLYPEMLNLYRSMAASSRADLSDNSFKLYLSRTQLRAKKETGEEEIEYLFKKAGFTIIYPEQISQTELIGLVRRSKTIAAIEGTITHNIVFSADNTEIILLRKLDYENTRQRLFDEAVSAKVKYIEVYFKPFSHFPINHDLGPYWIGARNSLIKELEQREFSIDIRNRLYILYRHIVNAIIYTTKCCYYRLVLKY